MTECPPERHTGSPCLEGDPANDFVSCHAQLSLTGQRVLDRLLLLLPSRLKSQPMFRSSPFPSALLYSICDALQLGSTDIFPGQNDPSILPMVLRKLRDWRLLGPDYRYSLGGILELALDLARIADEASAPTSSDLNTTSRAHLRVRWVGLDSPSKSPDRESSLPTPPSPSLLPPLGVVQGCVRSLPDPNRRPLDDESYLVDKSSTPDSEDVSTVASPQHLFVAGFRSGCSACRHLRLSGVPTPPSPHAASVPFSRVNRFDMNITSSIPASLEPAKSNIRHATTRKTKRDKPKSMQLVSRGAHVDENEPLVPRPVGIPHGIRISSLPQRTHVLHISGTYLPREPFCSVATSAQRRLEPSPFSNAARQLGDKHISSQRIASIDLRLPMADPSPSLASPNDYRPLAQHFSYTPVKPNNAHGLGLGVSVRLPTLSSNAPDSRSSKRLPSCSTTHLVRRPTATTSVTPGSLSPLPAKVHLGNPRMGPSKGTRLSPSSTSIPRHAPNDAKHRDDRRLVSSTSRMHVHAGVLPLSSPQIPARK